MRRKIILVSAILVSSALAGATTSTMLAYQSARTVPAPASPQGLPHHTGPVDEKWEYRLLTSDSERYNPGETPLPHLTYLEKRINELANEGFEVQSMHPFSGDRRHSEVLVLLRRPMK